MSEAFGCQRRGEAPVPKIPFASILPVWLSPPPTGLKYPMEDRAETFDPANERAWQRLAVRHGRG